MIIATNSLTLMVLENNLPLKILLYLNFAKDIKVTIAKFIIKSIFTRPFSQMMWFGLRAVASTVLIHCSAILVTKVLSLKCPVTK